MVQLENFKTLICKGFFLFLFYPDFSHSPIYRASLYIKGFSKIFFKANEKGNPLVWTTVGQIYFFCQINKKKIFLKKNLGRLDILFKLDPV